MKKSKGFTLAELLFVVGIIAVLTIVSIPVFAKQTEKSNEETDIANMKACKSVANSQFLSGVDLEGNILTSKGFTCYFDAASGILTMTEPNVYGKGTENDASCEDFYLVTRPTASIPQAVYTSTTNVTGKYLTVFIDANGTIKCSWDGENSEATNKDKDKQESSGYTPPEGAEPFVMNHSNRSMAGYKSSNYNMPSTFTYEDKLYYITELTDNAFEGYSGTVTIPESVSRIDITTFKESAYIEGFNVYSKSFKLFSNDQILATSDGKTLIKAVTNITLIEFPEGVTDVGYAFTYCSRYLKEIYLPDTVNILHEGAFNTLSGLSKISIPGSVKTIPAYTIKTPQPVTITLGEGVETIEKNAILISGGTISIPSTIKSIDANGIIIERVGGPLQLKYNGSTYTTVAKLRAAIG